MRIAILSIAVGGWLGLSVASDGLEPIPPYIEAWCDGGIDGRYQHVTVDPYGTIRATKDHKASKPWPEVAKDADAAARWFAAIEAAEPIRPGDLPPTAADQIYCGLELNKGQESVLYDLPDVLREIVVFAPDYH